MFPLIIILTVVKINTGLSTELPEAVMRTEEIIRQNGYPVEMHEVPTGDGYLLTMHRIPHGKVNSSNSFHKKKKKLVYIQHGLLGSSSGFVTSRPNECLAFTLADAGYDVWLGNTRGNRYSTKHLFLDTESDEYWNFSFDEMAEYDIPAMLNHALITSNQTHLYYVGHSQGSLLAFAAFTENEQLRSKVKGFFAMAPVARLKHIDHRVKIASRIFYGLKWVVDGMHITRIFPSLHSLKSIAIILCPFNKKLCDMTYHLAANYDTRNLDLDRLPVYLSHLPEGTSIKNLYHFCQLISSGKFQKYDYGWFGNLLNYGSRTAPEYDLTKFNIPVSLFSGSKDIVVKKEDVDWIAGQLPRVLHNIVVDGYGHVDFQWSMTAREDIYEKIIHTIEHEID